jgi:hypothetical protein
MIELTPEQRQAAEQGEAVRVVDPTTHDTYVLLRAELYERLTGAARPATDEADFEIPPGILRSMQAFWRELPELLKNKRNHGKWVAHHGDERIGIERDKVTLMREIVRRNIPSDAYYITTIHPSELPPWEPEEIEPIGPWHFDDAEDKS